MALRLELLLCKTTNTSNTSHPPNVHHLLKIYTARSRPSFISVTRGKQNRKIVHIPRRACVFVPWVAPCKVIRIPGNFSYWNPESRKIVFLESGMLGFGIRIPALGIRNPTNDWNPESLFRTRNPERIRIPQCGLQNPRLSWGYQGRSSRFFTRVCSRSSVSNAKTKRLHLD